MKKIFTLTVITIISLFITVNIQLPVFAGEPAGENPADSMTDYEVAMTAFSALRAGNTQLLLDLCAAEEFIETKYIPLAAAMKGGSRALTEYEVPELSDQTIAILSVLRKADLAGNIMAGLFELIEGSSDSSYFTLDVQNMDSHVSGQAITFEEELERFDFSDIHYLYTAKLSCTDAAEQEWISGDMEEMAYLLPMFRELEGVDSYIIDSCVYCSLIDYKGHDFLFMLPLFRYQEGWRIQDFSVFPVDNMEDVLSILSTYGEVSVTETSLPETSSADAGSYRQESAETVVTELMNHLISGDYRNIGRLMDVSEYTSMVDVAEWFSGETYNPVQILSLGSYIGNQHYAFPTTVPGFAELNQVIFAGMDYSPCQFLWDQALKYAKNKLVEGISQVQVNIENYYWAMLTGDSSAMESGLGTFTPEEIENLKNAFPEDMASGFFCYIDYFWELLAHPVAYSEIKYEGEELQRFHTYLAGEPQQFVLVFSEDFTAFEKRAFSLFAAPAGDGYRLGMLLPNGPEGLVTAESNEDIINCLQEAYGNVKER